MNKVNIDGEEVYIKKGIFGFSVVHPIRNEDKTINWFNLIVGGSWFRFFIDLFIVLILLLAINEYVNNLKLCVDIISNATAQAEQIPQFNFPIG